jgi:hypothetical protein
MFDRSGAFMGACSLAVAFVVTAGCAARPLPPPMSYASKAGEVPAQGFSAMPHVITDDQPIRFVGLTSAERDAFEKGREAFEEGRQRRIESRKEARLSGRNSVGGMAFECVIATAIIFSPICLVVVPATYGVASTVERRRASAQEAYMPSLPSDQELSRLEAKIKQQITAQGVARRVLNSLRSDGQASGDSGFPRLRIRADSATFGPDRMITIKVVVQAEPAAGVTWPPTEHRYHLGYVGEIDRMDSGLNEAEASIAASISSTYSVGVPPAQIQ